MTRTSISRALGTAIGLGVGGETVAGPRDGPGRRGAVTVPVTRIIGGAWAGCRGGAVCDDVRVADLAAIAAPACLARTGTVSEPSLVADAECSAGTLLRACQTIVTTDTLQADGACPVALLGVVEALAHTISEATIVTGTMPSA